MLTVETAVFCCICWFSSSPDRNGQSYPAEYCVESVEEHLEGKIHKSEPGPRNGNRGYYTVARGYEFYVREARTISHSFVALTLEILYLPREHKIHIFEPTCSFYYINILMTVFLMIFRRSPTTFRRFPKIFQNCSEGQTNVPEHFPRISEKFSKMSEDFRRLPKTFAEDPKMFRCYTKEFKYNLRDELDITEIIDIFIYKQ